MDEQVSRLVESGGRGRCCASVELALDILHNGLPQAHIDWQSWLYAVTFIAKYTKEEGIPSLRQSSPG